MTVEEMKRLKAERGYSYAQMAELSGVPLGTIQKVFSGETTNPRYDTLQALEKLFSAADCVKETCLYSTKQQGQYTIEDYYALPDEKRVELIDGYIYDMAAPTAVHQLIAGEVYRQISNFILDNNGKCIPFIAPLDVQLDCDEKTMVQPDVIILCDSSKKKQGVIFGAPDFVLEVLSPSTRRKDSIKKLAKYCDAGVKEYWLIDPVRKTLLVYDFQSEVYPALFGMDKAVPINLYNGKLEITFQHIEKWLAEMEN